VLILFFEIFETLMSSFVPFNSSSSNTSFSSQISKNQNNSSFTGHNSNALESNDSLKGYDRRDVLEGYLTDRINSTDDIYYSTGYGWVVSNEENRFKVTEKEQEKEMELILSKMPDIYLEGDLSGNDFSFYIHSLFKSELPGQINLSDLDLDKIKAKISEQEFFCIVR